VIVFRMAVGQKPAGGPERSAGGRTGFVARTTSSPASKRFGWTSGMRRSPRRNTDGPTIEIGLGSRGSGHRAAPDAETPKGRERFTMGDVVTKAVKRDQGRQGSPPGGQATLDTCHLIIGRAIVQAATQVIRKKN